MIESAEKGLEVQVTCSILQNWKERKPLQLDRWRLIIFSLSIVFYTSINLFMHHSAIINQSSCRNEGSFKWEKICNFAFFSLQWKGKSDVFNHECVACAVKSCKHPGVLNISCFLDRVMQITGFCQMPMWASQTCGGQSVSSQ